MVVLMSPVSTMMIHNPWTIAMGDENKKVQEELKAPQEDHRQRLRPEDGQERGRDQPPDG